MPHTLKRFLKLVGKVLLGAATFVVLYFTAAYALSRITIDGEHNEKDEVTIYIKTNGVHTDIVMPVHSDLVDWSKEIQYANTESKDTGYSYLALGWGDKGFYLQTPNWSDLKFSVAFKAAFGLSTTAMHATFYRQLVEDDKCRMIKISKEQYARLINYVQSTFRKDVNGHFVNIKTTANYGVSDAFYEANGRYNLFRTCNTWANAALKNCGQKCCLWTIFDTGIFLKYKT